MHKATVKTDFSSSPDDDLDNIAGGIYLALNGNGNFTFTDTDFTIADLNTAVNLYHTKLNAAQGGDSTAISQKNDAKKELVRKLSHMGTQVNLQAAGDETKLKTSGYPMAADHSPRHMIKPEWVKAANVAGQAGTIEVKVPNYEQSYGTIFFTAPVPAPADMSAWTKHPTKAHKLHIAGFTSLTKVAVCAAYQGNTNDPLVYSDIITISVL